MVMLIIMILMLSAPYCSMFIVVLVAILAGNNVIWIWIPFLCGVFIGGIASMFFETVGETILVASDSTLVAMAIDEDCLSKEQFEAKAAENAFMGFMVAEAVKAAEAQAVNGPPPVAVIAHVQQPPAAAAAGAPPPPPPAGAGVPPPPPPAQV